MPLTTTATGRLALPPEVICAWCDRSMGEIGVRRRPGRDAASHGLCGDCIEQLLDSLLVAPEPRPARRLRPLRRVVREIASH